VYVCLRKIKHFSIVNFFFWTFFFYALRTFVEQMHRFKRFVVKSSFVSIVFSNVSNISNNSLDEFFMTIKKNSSTSWIDFKLCTSNENVDVSSKSSKDIELSANDNNNESIEIWKDINLFTSTSWSFLTKNFATRKHYLIRKNEQIRIQSENDIIDNDLNDEFSIWRWMHHTMYHDSDDSFYFFVFEILFD
jgi:hypothetical protein